MNKEFQTYALNQAGIDKSNRIAEAFDRLLVELTTPIPTGDGSQAFSLCPPTRELAIVRTKLEEAAFFAKKAMASEPVNQMVAGNAAR